jgi:Holliday junction resolvase RusA-like endonuclease
MTPIRVFVTGDPKGQPRPRAFYRKGLGVRVYDAGTAEGWKSQVALALHNHGSLVTDAPFRLELRFVMARPKSHYRKDGTLTPSAPRSHTSKPDSDNLAKAVLDAMSQLNIWHDDSQVDQLFVTKRWAMRIEDPSGCEIRITQGATPSYVMPLEALDAVSGR